MNKAVVELRPMFDVAVREIFRGLKDIGFAADACREHVPFVDWFSAEATPRAARAVAYGRTPHTYESACFTAIAADRGNTGASLVNDHRSVGAPFAFEISSESVRVWSVGGSLSSTRSVVDQIPIDRIREFIRDRRSEWHPLALIRAKTLGAFRREYQADLVDVGLIPALEWEIAHKLDHEFSQLIEEAQAAHRAVSGDEVGTRELFRLIFRVLAAKVMRDRGVRGFAGLDKSDGAKAILERIARHYRDPHGPKVQLGAVAQVVVDRLWSGFDLSGLSVEILAYIYENTLVAPATRASLGTHGTPHQVARFIAGRLPFEAVPEGERFVVEPCSGHGVLMVAALQRLRDLCTEQDGLRRHEYFKERLRGCEIDSFAAEVNRLCLMLADFPYPNGWKIREDDVFTSQLFRHDLTEARFVVCNPPFEDFAEDQRGTTSDSVNKPTQVINLILKHAHPNANLGLVLPTSFIDGRRHAPVRRALAERFGSIEVLSLPDRIFRKSTVASAVIVATEPRTGGKRSRVRFTLVHDHDRDQFLLGGRVLAARAHDRTIDELAGSFVVSALAELWKALADGPRLGRTCTAVHRGVEWKSPFSESTFIHDEISEGYVPGYHKASESKLAFEAPPLKYLLATKKFRRRNAWDLEWNKAKLYINAVRSSRSPWRVRAFAGKPGTYCTKNFIAIWPSEASAWTRHALVGVLNSAVANLFVHTHAHRQHNPSHVIEQLPLPDLKDEEIEELDVLVSRYTRLLRKARPADAGERRELLAKIDDMVSGGYRRAAGKLVDHALEFMAKHPRPMGDIAPDVEPEFEFSESANEVAEVLDLLQDFKDSGVNVPNVEAVAAMLKGKPALARLLEEVVAGGLKRFGHDYLLSVEVVSSRECDDAELFVYLVGSKYPAELLDETSRFTTRYLDRCGEGVDAPYLTLAPSFRRLTP